jgi:hypothetical protein
MRRLLAVALINFAVADPGARVVAAEACPVDDKAVEKAGGYVNAIEVAVNAESTCESSYRTYVACQLGSSGDNALAEIVRGKCEPLFIGKLSPATKAAYKKAQARCNQIAEKNQGTMYQGLAAVCRAKAARDLARRYSRGRYTWSGSWAETEGGATPSSAGLDARGRRPSIRIQSVRLRVFCAQTSTSDASTD